MTDWLKKHLLPDAKIWWRLSSSRFQMIAAGALAAIIANPEMLLSVSQFLPEGAPRLVIAVACGVVYFCGDRLLRLWREDRLPTNEELTIGE